MNLFPIVFDYRDIETIYTSVIFFLYLALSSFFFTYKNKKNTMENLKTSNAKITIDIDYDGTYAYYEIGDIDLALSIKFDYDGRCQFLLIEPSFFASDEEEKYYEENQEQIDAEITEAYYNLQK